MGDPVATIGAAAGIFAGTNVDDMVVLTVLFLSAHAAGKPRPWQIWTGQYIGVSALVAISAIAALGLTLVPDQWVGLVGLVPLVLGARGLIKAFRRRPDEQLPPPAVAAGLAGVIGITMANGGDNISVYTPVFRTIGPAQILIYLVVFAAGVAVWCRAATWLGSHKKVIALIERFGQWIVPAVYIVIGVAILIKSGILARVLG